MLGVKRQDVTTGYVIFNSVFLAILLAIAICNTLFLIFSLCLYKDQDNALNSCCALCFILGPLFAIILSAIGLIVVCCLSSSVQLPAIRYVLTVVYALQLALSLGQFILLCCLMGTSTKGQTAYQGLVDRRIC